MKVHQYQGLQNRGDLKHKQTNTPHTNLKMRQELANRELDLRDEACEAFRDNVEMILQRCLAKDDMKTALKAQELLAKHYGLLPGTSRFRKVRFWNHMLAEHDFREIITDIGRYLAEEVGGVEQEEDCEASPDFLEEGEPEREDDPIETESLAHDSQGVAPASSCFLQQNVEHHDDSTETTILHSSPHPP